MVVEIILLYFNLYRFEERNFFIEVRYGGKKYFGFVFVGNFFFFLNFLIEYNFFIKLRYGGKKV